MKHFLTAHEFLRAGHLVKTKDCPDCQGEGLIVIIVDSFNSRDGHDAYEREIECDRCDGSGKVEDENGEEE